VGDPHRKAGRIGEHLQAAESVVLAGVPPVVTAFGPGGDPVGRHQGAVQAYEGQLGRASAGQDVVQVEGVRGDHGERLVQLATGGGDADPGLQRQRAQVHRCRGQRSTSATCVCTVPARCPGRDPGRRR
jgi:hypothetical protein